MGQGTEGIEMWARGNFIVPLLLQQRIEVALNGQLEKNQLVLKKKPNKICWAKLFNSY